jgi:hypothetical protein
MSNKPVVTMHLTQEEVDALYLICWNIGGDDKGYRGVFTGNGSSERGLLKWLSQYSSKGLTRRNFINVSVQFMSTRYGR